ncbi:MAG: right-handed parallel beta-helix repeat-containing protein [Desulfobaccales bacterium]
MYRFMKAMAVIVLTVTLGLGTLYATGGGYDAYKQSFGEARWQTKLNNFIEARSTSYTELSGRKAVYVAATRDGDWPNGPGYVVAADYGTDQAALSAADAVAAAAGKQLLIGRSYTISSGLTLSSAIKVMPGAVLTRGGGDHLTFNGSFEGPSLVQCFADNTAGHDWVRFGTVKKVYPEWWGIDGIDDDKEIQEAINSLYSGGNVLISEHNYIITSSLIGNSHVNLIGINPYLSRLSASSANMLTLKSKTGVQIENIGFYGTDNQNYKAIYLDNSTLCNIINCYFNKQQYQILLENNSKYNKIISNYFTDAHRNFIYISKSDYNLVSGNHMIKAEGGMSVNNSNHNIVTDNYIKCNPLRGYQGIYIHTGSCYNKVSNNTIIDTYMSGIYIYDGNIYDEGPLNTIGNVIINNTTINCALNKGTEAGITVMSVSCYDTIVESNIVKDSASYGIYIQSADKNIIKGNSVYGSVKHGIYYHDGGNADRTCTLEGNSCTQNDSYDTDTYSGICVVQTSTSAGTCFIIGNYCSGSKQKYGISIDHANCNVTIANNICTNNKTNGIHYNGSATIRWGLNNTNSTWDRRNGADHYVDRNRLLEGAWLLQDHQKLSWRDAFIVAAPWTTR